MYSDFGDLSTFIRNLESQIIEEEKQKNQAKNAAKCAHNIYEAYVSAGFSKEQAWELLITITKNAR